MDREDLDPIDRVFLHIIQTAAKGHDEVWAGVDKLSVLVNRSVRWVQLRLKRYAEMGLVETVRDYSLKTRRRIVLLWRKAANPALNPAQEPTRQTTEGAMRDDLRPVRRPSIQEPAETPAVAEAAPLVSTRGGGEAEGRKATPEEVRDMMDAAAKVDGSTPRKAKSMARAVGADVLRICSRYAAEHGKGWGWVVTVAPAWRKDGIPDYAAESTPSAPPPLKSYEEELAEYNRIFGPGGTYQPSPLGLSAVG